MFNNIPDELKQLPQWVNWKIVKEEGKNPTKVPLNPHDGSNAKSDEPSTWGAYELALGNVHLCDGIGFMLSEDDDYGFIDVDDPYGRNANGSAKYDKPEEIFERQKQIVAAFKSYTEYSPSGTGLHIICKGKVDAGRRRSAVEVYTSGRFMTMTGNVYRDAPIQDENKLLNILWAEMGTAKSIEFYDGNAPQREDDQVIIDRALAASNGDKFNELLNANWQGAYPSQSEADLAFINIIAFYTQNREQLKRIFNCSRLGARNKQTTIRGIKYLDYMINKSFDRMLPPIDLDGLKNQLEEALAKQRKTRQPPAIVTTIAAEIPMPAPPVPGKPVIIPQAIELEAYGQASHGQDSGPYTVPPGLVGDIAQFIYAAAPRPVPEIALAGALGLMAGICGRAFNVSATGLNQYILLLAPTGTGKESIHSGISRLMNQVRKTVPAAMEFIGPGEIASPQALTKFLGKVPSFVSIVGEFGMTLKMLSDPRAPAHLVGLRKAMLNLYNKSGQSSTLEASIFADSEKNSKVVQAPNYSMVGESTPETFYEVLDDTMVNDGLLPRMSIIEYTGIRVPLNEGHGKIQPDFRLVERVAQMCAHAMMLNGAHKAVDLKFTDEADAIQRRFNVICDQHMNPGKDGVPKRNVIVNLWNRAHIKALKLAAVVAVGCNLYDPVIDAEMMQWAIRICVADANAMSNRFEKGEVGTHSEESKQTADMRRIVKEYVTRPWSEIMKYGGSANMHSERVIPLVYVSRRLASMSHFKNDRSGATMAIKKCLQNLIDMGDLVEITPQERVKRSLGSGKSFFIGALGSFGL